MKRSRLVFLLLAAAVLLAISVLAGRRGESVAPTQSPPSLPPASVVAARPGAPSSAPAAVAPPASLPLAPASAAPVSPPPDVSRIQREIQVAISSNQRGRAREGARLIQTCQADERIEKWERGGEKVHRLPLSEAVRRQGIASYEQLRTSCQAVDAASREQLVPLLRRSVAEGDIGAASALAGALGPAFDVAAEHAVMAALRRDAWNCDAGSQSLLSNMAMQHPGLLTPSERGALNELARARISAVAEAALSKSPDNPELKAVVENFREIYRAPPGANPAEVAQLASDIQSRCKAER